MEPGGPGKQPDSGYRVEAANKRSAKRGFFQAIITTQIWR